MTINSVLNTALSTVKTSPNAESVGSLLLAGMVRSASFSQFGDAKTPALKVNVVASKRYFFIRKSLLSFLYLYSKGGYYANLFKFKY